MDKNLLSIMRLIDSLFSRFSLRFFQGKNSLLTFAFHGLFRKESERILNLVDPRPWITIDDFNLIVEYYLNHDYLFISPDDILNGLKNDAKYVLITFDDGYFNNQYVLPILKKYRIPAIFFISTNHVKYNKCFWWDVLYREGIKNGMSIDEITRINKQLKLQTTERSENHLKALFGEEIFKPSSDIDRPFTPLELKDFSRGKFIFLGNHTSNHNILTNYPPSEIKSLILRAQVDLYDITGIYPRIISYPNGNCSNEIIRISKEIGLKLGFTVEFKKDQLPIDCSDDDCMRLGRFDFYGCDKSNELLKQCEIFRSDVALCNWIIRNLSKSTKSMYILIFLHNF